MFDMVQNTLLIINKTMNITEHLSKAGWKRLPLTLSWRRSLSHRNQSFDFFCKSIDCFWYDNDLSHERVKATWNTGCNQKWIQSCKESQNRLNILVKKRNNQLYLFLISCISARTISALSVASFQINKNRIICTTGVPILNKSCYLIYFDKTDWGPKNYLFQVSYWFRISGEPIKLLEKVSFGKLKSHSHLLSKTSID